MNQLSFFFPFIIILGPMFVVLVFVHLYQWLRKQKGFRSPLKGQLLRPAGESLRAKIEDLNAKLNEALFMVAFIPSIFSISIISWVLALRKNIDTIFIFIGITTFIGVTGYYVTKIIKLLSDRRDLRLGLDGELAVAEELNKLMLDGYHVYHDFPAEKFNIDHILIGRGGIFAVETKARSKRKKKRGTTTYEVTYDGNKLSFPGGYDIDSLTQAKSQGKWLEKWLTSAVGERVGVEPVVTLPGWYVKRTKPEGFSVLNPKEIRGYVASKKSLLSEAMIKRIVHQVEQKCRNIEPKEG